MSHESAVESVDRYETHATNQISLVQGQVTEIDSQTL